MKTIKLCFFFLLLINKSFSQSSDAEKIVNRAISVLENTPVYKLSTTINFYMDRNSISPREVTKAICYREGKNYYTKIKDSEIMYINNIYINVNHKQKAMSVTSSGGSGSSAWQATGKLKLSDYKKKTIADKQTFWRCTLYPVQGSTSSIYEYVIIDISKTNYRILKEAYYYKESIASAYGVKSKGKEWLEIVYDEFNPSAVIPKGLFQLNTYVKPVGKNYIGVGKQSGYKII